MFSIIEKRKKVQFENKKYKILGRQSIANNIQNQTTENPNQNQSQTHQIQRKQRKNQQIQPQIEHN